MIKSNSKIFLSLAALLFSAAGFSQSALVMDGAYIVMTGGTKTTPIYLDVDDQATNGIVNKIPGTGSIISEGEFNQVKWEIQNNTGSFVVPFGNSTVSYIPLTMNITSAGVGNGSIKFATYGDLGWDNLTYIPSDVTNMNGSCLTDDSKYAVDRFWIIDTGSVSGVSRYTVKPTSNITFTYTGSEINAPNNITEAKLAAQRFNDGASSTWWDWPGATGTDNNVAKTVSTGNITPANLFRSWTLLAPEDSVTAQGHTVSCGGAQITISSTYTNVISYSWSTGATTSSITITPLGPVLETDTISLANGCRLDSNVQVVMTPNPIPTISATQAICIGNSANLLAGGGTTYTWLPSAGLSSDTIADPVANPATTTVYTVTIANGPCKATDNVQVTVDPLPVVTVCCGVTIIQGETTALSATPIVTGNTYNWTPNIGLTCNNCPNPVASPTVSTWYSVTETDSLGCSKNDSVLINVKENCIGTTYVPNAFSPNGDGINDVLKVMGKCLMAMDFRIFDRWGNVVFETNNPAEGWDGTCKGKPMNTGTFVYYLEASGADNIAISKKGDITLVR